MPQEKKITPCLSQEEYSLILENSSVNLFVTDGQGKIIYANSDNVKDLHCPLEELLSMDVHELKSKGYVSYSTTSEVLKTKKQVVNTYFNKEGREIAAVSTPVFDENGYIKMIVTYSRSLESLESFQKELQEQKDRVKGYQDVLEYYGRTNIESREIVVKDPAMVKIFQILGQIAKTDITVMLYGESGVGKEVVANYIQHQSLRHKKICLPINCATIPHDLIESELFGYEKGSFTGADNAGKAGLFELANGGTLFMDEIGELPLTAQSKLLRVMETGDYRRIGGKQTQVCDVRIIGATNRDLKQMVQKNLFRADLYYRLNVVPINIPPLRLRPLEFEAFTNLFLQEFNRKHGKSIQLSVETQQLLKNYDWPGNIRELRNVLERYVITGDERGLLKDCFVDDTLNFTPSLPDLGYTIPTLNDFLSGAEANYLTKVMQYSQNNVDQAASILNICKSGLYKKLKKIKKQV